MQIIAYPIALRVTISQLDLERETGQISDAEYLTVATKAIQAAKQVLIANGSLDDSWTDTGPSGATPIPFADNPQGMTQIFYNGTQL